MNSIFILSFGPHILFEIGVWCEGEYCNEVDVMMACSYLYEVNVFAIKGTNLV